MVYYQSYLLLSVIYYLFQLYDLINSNPLSPNVTLPDNATMKSHDVSLFQLYSLKLTPYVCFKSTAKK